MPYTPPALRHGPRRRETLEIPSSGEIAIATPNATSSPPTSQARILPRAGSYLTKDRQTSIVTGDNDAPEDQVIDRRAAPGAGTYDSDESIVHNTHGSNQSFNSPSNTLDTPSGAIITPPESSEDEDEDEDENQRRDAIASLEKLREALSQIPSSYENTTETPVNFDTSTSPLNARRTSHSHFSSEIALPQNYVSATSTEPQIHLSEDSESDELRVKPPLLRKKTGELVKPLIRPPSRRKPSSMPGTPTYSKAVHFKQDIEQVRHFLRVDRPMAISSRSSPIEEYDSENEFAFGISYPPKREEWEIKLINFPSGSERQKAPVYIERIFLASDRQSLIGVVTCANFAMEKGVTCRFTLDDWKTTSEVVAEYNHDVRRKNPDNGRDRFNFTIKLTDYPALENKSLHLCVRYSVNGKEYWDNNNLKNYRVEFVKRTKTEPDRGRSIPSSRIDPSILRQQSMLPVEDSDEDKPVLRLHSSQNPGISSTSHAFRHEDPSQAFSNRYDFGAALTAALAGGQNALRRSTPKSKSAPGTIPETVITEKPDPQSEEYKELIEKYCFIGSRAEKVSSVDQAPLSDNSDFDIQPKLGAGPGRSARSETPDTIPLRDFTSDSELGVFMPLPADYGPDSLIALSPSADMEVKEKQKYQKQKEAKQEKEVEASEEEVRMEARLRGRELKLDGSWSEMKETETKSTEVEESILSGATISVTESLSEHRESVSEDTTLLNSNDSLMAKVEDQSILDLSKGSEDYMSLPSNDEDIASQAARQRTEQEILAVKLFSLFLAQCEELSGLHENALRKIGPSRFLENYRRILKAYVLKLRLEARTALEKDTVKVIESRGNRRSIAKQIVDFIALENEENVKPLVELAQLPLMKQNLEDWAKTAYGMPDATEESTPEQAEYFSEESDEEDDSDSRHEDWNADHLQTLTFTTIDKAYRFLYQSLPFQTLVLQLRLLALPTSLREIIETCPRRSIKILYYSDMSLINRFKHIIESYTATQWDWWPLVPKVPYLESDRLLLEWQFCGKPLYMQILPDEAESIRKVIDTVGEHPSNCHCCKATAPPLDWHTAFWLLFQGFRSWLPVKLTNPQSPNITTPSQANLRYTPSSASASTGTSSSLPPAQSALTPSSNPPAGGNATSQVGLNPGVNQMPADALCVVFGIRDMRGFDAIENIETDLRLDDTSFFQDMKKRHGRYRWFFQRWFSPYRFRYCRFVQFERIIVDEVSCCGEALPDEHGYTVDYTYRPRPPVAKQPLIDPARFSILLKICNTSCYWSLLPKYLHKCSRLPTDSQEWLRIPQRKGAFATTNELYIPGLTVAGKVAFGIEADYLPSSAFFFLYHAVLILSGFGFWIYWLKEHPGDLQNASVPLFTMFALIAAFWAFVGKGTGTS